MHEVETGSVLYHKQHQTTHIVERTSCNHHGFKAHLLNGETYLFSHLGSIFEHIKPGVVCWSEGHGFTVEKVQGRVITFLDGSHVDVADFADIFVPDCLHKPTEPTNPNLPAHSEAENPNLSPEFMEEMAELAERVMPSDQVDLLRSEINACLGESISALVRASVQLEIAAEEAEKLGKSDAARIFLNISTQALTHKSALQQEIIPDHNRNNQMRIDRLVFRNGNKFTGRPGSRIAGNGIYTLVSFTLTKGEVVSCTLRGDNSAEYSFDRANFDKNFVLVEAKRRFHADNFCGSCAGPLDDHRDAICCDCQP